MTDRYGAKNHLLRRWVMNEAGVIACPYDAIDVRINPAAVVSAVEAHNELLHDAEAERIAYLQAMSVQFPHGEPETINVIDEEGEEQIVPNPLHTAWNEAQTIIENTSDAVKAWIEADQAEPEPDTDEHDAWVAAVTLRNETFIDTAPDFTPVTDSPLLVPLKRWAFEAVIDLTPGLRTQIETAIGNIPASPQKVAIQKRFEATDEYDATDELFTMLKPMVGITDQQFADLWSYGIQIQNGEV